MEINLRLLLLSLKINLPFDSPVSSSNIEGELIDKIRTRFLRWNYFKRWCLYTYALSDAIKGIACSEVPAVLVLA
jgi:hypothetical protein